MGALAFQNVMAQLIRFPSDSLKEIQQRLDNPDLTTIEQEQLQKMEADPLVRGFGYKMRFSRQRDAAKMMRLSKDIITPQVLDRVYRDLFEASQPSIDLDTIGLQFLEFCLNNPEAQNLLSHEEPYLTDVLRYELSKAQTEFEVIQENDSRLPPGSRLSHANFRILDFNYDVPTADRLKAKDPDARPVPVKKQMKLIFMSIQEYPYCRIFQIDGAIEEFLRIQLSDPTLWTASLPAAYEGMVKVGLCRKS